MTYPEDFLAFWAKRPHRIPADSDKKGAFKEWEKAVKAGVTVETMMAGWKIYNEDMREAGNLGTPYIKHARRWLHGWCWEEPLERQVREREERASRSEADKQISADMVKRCAAGGLPLPRHFTPEAVRVLLDEGLITVEHARAVGVEPRLRAVG